MPRIYVKPEGTRKLEFWKTFRGGATTAVVNVPREWDDSEIKDELEDWCGFEFHNSDFMSYGWNDEKDFGSRT